MVPPLKTHWQNTFGLTLLLACLVGWGWNASRGWNTPGMLGHEFRQAQTALSVQAMQRDGFRLDYSTPILGKPWAIPMEFPLYQRLVSTYSNLTGEAVVQSGRMVSAILFIVGLLGVVALGRVLGFSWGASSIATVPIIAAPVYLFYSRAVMIESLAWSSSVWFLVGVLSYRARQDRWSLVLALGAGAIAVLVKATTWAAFCLPWAVWFFYDGYHALKRQGTDARSLLVQSFGIGVPLLVLGFSWVAFADSIKAQNPLAHFLLSAELKAFNFGTWEMRFDAENWAVMKEHWSRTFLPWWLWSGGLVVTLGLSRRRLLIGAMSFGFLGSQLIFFNLYRLHDYYFYANAALGCLVVGFGAAALWECRGRWFQGVAPALVTVVVIAGVQLREFSDGFRQLQVARSDGFTALSYVLPALTEPDEVIVAHAPGWGASEAFYADRRMLMIPDAQMFFNPDRVTQSLALLADESVPLLLMMRESRIQSDWLSNRIEDLGLWPVPLFETDSAVTAYARADRYGAMRAKVAAGEFAGIRLLSDQPKAPLEDRVLTAGSSFEADFDRLEIHPVSIVFPFGVGIYDDEEGSVLSTHAPTEMYFEIPPAATKLRFQFGLGDDVVNQQGFDGLGVNVELIHPDGTGSVIHSEWVPHGTDRPTRDVEVSLPTERSSRLLYHVVPGPQNQNAYDQAWLRYLRFE